MTDGGEGLIIMGDLPGWKRVSLCWVTYPDGRWRKRVSL